MRNVCLSIVVLLALSVPAQAAPILVSAGDVLIFNFDLTSSTPAPPYARVNFDTNVDFSTFDFDEVGTWQFFSDLNAGGSLFLTMTLPSELGNASPRPGWNDGIFSARLTLTQGSFVIDPRARGQVTSGAISPYVAGTLASTAVPEPASMLLLGTGLAGAGLRRWRQKRA